MTSTKAQRRAITALCCGLGLTAIATALPYADSATTQLLASHIREGYPAYSAAQVDSAVTAYQVILTAVGALGAAAWAIAIGAAAARKRWAAPLAPALFAAAVLVGLTLLLTPDTNGKVGLAPALGVPGMAPTVAGLAAVVLLWKSRPARVAVQQ